MSFDAKSSMVSWSRWAWEEGLDRSIDGYCLVRSMCYSEMKALVRVRYGRFYLFVF
jgi:hypothetical protein